MKIAVIGANGRMGSLLCDAIKNEHTVQKIDINTKDKFVTVSVPIDKDISMLSHEEIKKTANFTTGSNNDNSVMKEIEKYCF